MNRGVFHWTVCSGMVLILSACGGGGGGGSSAGQVTSDAEGVWRQACIFDAEDEDFSRDELEISGESFDLVSGVFQDADCTMEVQRTSVSGSFITRGTTPIAGRGDATQIDVTSNGVTAILFSDELVARASDQSLCGVDNWQSGVSVDISNCDDINGTAVPTTLFDIYLREGNLLFLGIEVGETAATRPVVLDQVNPYTLVSPPVDPDSSGEDQLPEQSLVLTADNGVPTAQFVIALLDTIESVTSAANAAIMSTGSIQTGDTLLTEPSALTIDRFCQAPESVSVTGNVTIGGSLSAVFDNCTIGTHQYTGTLQFELATVLGTPGTTDENWSYTAAVQMDDFTLVSGDRSQQLSGTVDLTAVFQATTEVPGAITARFQGTRDQSILVSESGELTGMTGFDFLFSVVNQSPSVYAVGFDEARVSSTLLGGRMTIEQLFTYGGTGESVLESGTLEIFGANSAQLSISAEGSNTGRLELDADGDGEANGSDDLVDDFVWDERFPG